VQNAARYFTAAGYRIVERCDCEPCFHALVDRVANDPVRAQVLDGAKIDFAFVGLDSSDRRNG
jgi:hypothetical protein